MITPALYSFYGFMVGFFSLWLVNAVYKFFRKKDGIGGGDFILFGGIGTLIGPFYLPLVLLFGSLVFINNLFNIEEKVDIR